MTLLQQCFKSFEQVTIDGNKFLILHCTGTSGEIKVYGSGMENYGGYQSLKSFRNFWKAQGNKLILE